MSSNLYSDMVKLNQQNIKEFSSRLELFNFMGMNNFTKTDSNFVIKTKDIKDEYTIYDATMDTEPGITMPFFILTPPEADDINSISNSLSKYPVVVLPHGHGSDGRYGVVGILRDLGMENNLKKYNHDIGIQFVRRGYIVICPDSRGAGDRRNPKEDGMELNKLLSSSCTDLNNAFITLGSSLIAACSWDFMKLIDLIIDKGFGNPNRIGVCGFSGGGLQSLFLGALDSRVKCVGSSGYFFRYEDCLLTRNLCSCNFIPSFSNNYSMSTLCYLIAPGALIIEKGVNDPLNGEKGIEGPRLLVKPLVNKYQELNISSKLQFSEFEGEHQFNGKDIFPFFDKNL